MQIPTSGGVPITGPIFGFKTVSAAERETFSMPETVSGILDHSFELPPLGMPIINMSTGEVINYATVWRIEEMPADMRANSMRTQAGNLEARKEALQNYGQLKSEIQDTISERQKTRLELMEKLASLPQDDESLPLRDLLNGYIKRLDKSLRETQTRLDRLEENFGADGVYRKNINAGLSDWMPSGRIYNETLITKLYRAETVDEMLEQAGKLFEDMQKKLTDLPSDAGWQEREETKNYIYDAYQCLDSAKRRLKEDFGWEGSDQDLMAAGKAANAALVNELADADPADSQAAFLDAVADRQKNWTADAGKNPLDIIEHYMRALNQLAGETRSRLKPLPEDSSWYDQMFNTAWAPALMRTSLPQSKVSNPALINELAEQAEQTQFAAAAE